MVAVCKQFSEEGFQMTVVRNSFYFTLSLGEGRGDAFYPYFCRNQTSRHCVSPLRFL